MSVVTNAVTVLNASGTQIGSYSTITDALTNASAGDTVFVGNGTYDESVALVNGVNVEGQSQAGVIINGTVSTPADFDNTTVSNLTVNDNSSAAMLLDMTATQEVTSSKFSNVTFNLETDSIATQLIGNGQVSTDIALNGSGLTFSGVTMNSNDYVAGSTAFAYTLFHSVNGAQLVLNDVSLNGTASGGPTGLGAQWNMSPEGNEGAAVTIEHSSTSGGGNFYVSGMNSATIFDNTFNGQGLALNGVSNATVINNTFENIDGSITANGIQDRGLTIENAWGATGDFNIIVENNIFQNITAPDGAIAFQRWTDGNGDLIPATIAELNNVDIQGNTFTGVNTPVYLNPNSFNASTVIPDTFAGSQLIVGTAGADTINDTSTGPMTIFGGGGGDTINGGSGNTTYYASQGDTITDAGGTDTVISTGDFTLPANIENLTLIDGDSNTQTFDNMPVGPITNGEDGWVVNTPGESEGVVAGPDGTNEFEMSSNPSNTDFGGPYSPGLSVAAGEPDAGAQFDGETISYQFQAVDPTPDGSRLEVDFGNADATDRNNFLVIESVAGQGLRIAVSEPDTSGNFDGDGTDPSPNDWRQLISGVDPTAQHTLTMQLAYVNGPNNDVINIYLDGQFIGSTTTFENYHDALGGTHDANAAANLTDRIFFRPSANGAPQGAGVNQGFYFDNITNSIYNNSNGTGNSLNNVITGNDGNNILTGLGGNDTLLGGAGFDTAAYTGTLTASDISYDSVHSDWIVNATNDGQNEGTDTLSQMEIVTDGGGHTFLLVGGGSQYQTIQEAIDAAQAGDIIIVAPGTYDEHVVINKAVTLEGSNAGVTGTSNSRGAESVITGGVEITAAGATIDGFTISGSYNSVAQNGTDRPNGMLIEAANATVENNVFTGDALDSRPLSSEGSATNLAFTNNLVQNWNEGFYIVNGGSGSVTNNTFVDDGNGVLTETTQVNISNNTFTGSVEADVAPLPFTDATIGNFVFGNTFNGGPSRPITVYLNGPTGQNVTGSGVATTFHLEYHNGTATVQGGSGNDAISFSDNTASVTIDLANGTANTNTNALGNADSVSFSGIENAIGGSGDDTFDIGNSGNETATGGGGLDTANFSSTLTAASFSFSNSEWVVTNGAGTDDLSGISLVTDSAKHTFLLVGGGSQYSTDDQAFKSAQFTPGDIIIGTASNSSVAITSGLSNNKPTTGTPLQATVSFTGGDRATSITYTWFANGNQAQSGSSSSFTPTEAELGLAITVQASFTDVFGDAVVESSAATGGVLDAAPTVTTPIIAGIAQVGRTLTASATATPADDTLTFEWFSSADNFTSPIAAGSTFKVTATGVSLEVEAIAANANGVQATATSAAIATAAAPPPAINFPHVAGSNVDEWILASGQWTASAQPGSIPSGYAVAGIGDFTGSGTSDILWQNSTTGDTQEWLLNNGAYNGTVDLGAHPGSFKIAGVGDFTGNGIDDVLWTSSTSGGVQIDIWELSSSGQWQASVSPGTHPAGYNVVGVGDFTGNGTSDILWQNPTTGDVDEWQIADGQWSASVDLGSHPGTGWTIAGVGDFTGNGIDDILWNNSSGGQVQTDIWELGSNGQWLASVSPGTHPAGYQVGAVGNFADTGTDGILWFNASTGDTDEWEIAKGQWAASVDLGAHGGQLAGAGAFVGGNATSDVLWQNRT